MSERDDMPQVQCDNGPINKKIKTYLESITYPDSQVNNRAMSCISTFLLSRYRDDIPRSMCVTLSRTG